MSTPKRSLIGSVVERTTPRTPSASSSRFSVAPETGFPVAPHRFKSAFARAQEEANSKSAASKQQPTQPPTPPKVETDDPKPIPTSTNGIRQQIHEENTRTIARMSDGEIEQEKQAILEQLGDGTTQLLKRVQEARRRREEKEKEASVQMELKDQARQEAPRNVDTANDGGARQTTDHDHAPLVSPIPRRLAPALATKPGILRVKSLENIARSVASPLPATSSTRPSSRTGRKLRFAEVTPDNVHVYESAPVSPKRTILALPPPPDTKDDSIVSLGTYQNKGISPRPAESKRTDSKILKGDGDPEEGTPEYIRRRYFPNMPSDDPNLAWMATSQPEATSASAPRFDLHGAPIPASLSESLPSHLGLHHHAEGSHAGYTIEDIFLLSRSTVPAQRASMLGILAKIAHRLGLQARNSNNAENQVLPGREGELRKRILSSGLAAIGQIGSIGVQAVEVVWECIVGWDGRTSDVEGVELTLAPDIVALLQPEQLLPQIAEVVSHAAIPSESLTQLLAILHWLAQQSNQIADMITNTPRLVPTILSTFLLTPIPPKEPSQLPNPLALRLLMTLASASRSNASALLDPADALLRFVTLPPSSPYSLDLTLALLTLTLRFYATLASYGLYSHIATTASPIFMALATHIHSTLPSSPNLSSSAIMQLRLAWAILAEVWTVCATDPHATNPPHEILWSQICAWGWNTDVRQFREGLDDGASMWALHAAIWDTEAAWLEGARINGMKSGERERTEALQVLVGTFSTDDGPDFSVLRRALELVQFTLGKEDPVTTEDGERALESLATAGNVLASALRLWSACLPPLDNGMSLSAPPFALPLSELSALSAVLAKHPVWSLPSKFGAAYLQVYLRPLSRFISYFHRVSRHIPGTTPHLWFAQALVSLPRLLRGDELYALTMLDAFSLVRPQLFGVDSAELPHDLHMDALQPFFEYAARPEGEEYVAPLRPNTESISRCLTLRLPSQSQSLAPVDDEADENTARAFTAGLPLTRDFLFTPLTHLLRSGVSPVFRALPSGWTASEVDVVRATLFLVYAARKVLIAHGLEWFVHTAAEVVFACMRVCMLEHGVGVGTGGTGMETEVFRDAGVERLMGRLLEPFTARLGSAARAQRAPTPPRTLEEASAPYLGSTPFYQFYTDLVALYGAVSFGHSIFSALLVTPLAMQYAVDYRRALWCGGDGASSGSGAEQPGAGLGDIVRSIRISVEDVICTVGEGQDPREYLYPVERDVGLLGAYTAALVARDGSGVEGFLRLIAVHHIACTLWEDLDPRAETDWGKDEDTTSVDAETKRREEMRVRLLRTLLARGGMDVVRDVVLYRQRSELWGTFVRPPACYRGGEDEGRDAAEWRQTRLAFVQRVMWDGEVGRVKALLMAA